MSHGTKAFLIFLFFILFPSKVFSALIFDSETEFSSVQGYNGWFYGYYDGDHANSFTPDDFEQLTQFTGTHWANSLGIGGYWTILNAVEGHPNGEITSGGRLKEEQHIVRRWISDYDGEILLSGDLFMKNLTNLDSNGVELNIFNNRVQIYSVAINGRDGVGAEITLPTFITVGDILDFSISPRDSNDWGDTFFFNINATQLVSATSPSSIALLSLAFFALFGFKEKHYLKIFKS